MNSNPALSKNTRLKLCQSHTGLVGTKKHIILMIVLSLVCLQNANYIQWYNDIREMTNKLKYTWSACKYHPNQQLNFRPYCLLWDVYLLDVKILFHIDLRPYHIFWLCLRKKKIQKINCEFPDELHSSTWLVHESVCAWKRVSVCKWLD